MAVFLASMHRSALNPKNCNRFLLLQDCVRDSKKRRTDRVNNSFWSNKQITDSSSIEKWLMARKKIGKFFFQSCFLQISHFIVIGSITQGLPSNEKVHNP